VTNWLALIAAYLIGGIPFGFLLVRWRTGADVRAMGSGNIGATNVLRTSGRVLGVATLLLDVLKAVGAVWIMDLVSGSPGWMAAAAVAVLAGHAYPALLKFQGGKAVASFLGAFLYLAPVPLLLTLIVFTVCVWVTRFISFGSIVGAALFPLAVWLTMQPDWPLMLAAVASSALIVWRHRANIQRLRSGTENVFTFSRRP
jgi:glycerol-3-phosphate acyltransferase PlsY